MRFSAIWYAIVVKKQNKKKAKQKNNNNNNDKTKTKKAHTKNENVANFSPWFICFSFSVREIHEYRHP